MTQLTYNEAFDPYHAVFRYIRLKEGCNLDGATHFDKWRILDFYLLFPFRIQNMSFFAQDRGWRRVSKSYEDQMPYGELPDDGSIFARMEPFQRAAISSLIKSGLLSAEAWRNEQVVFLDAEIPAQLLNRCESLNSSMEDIIEILCALRDRYPLLGHKGLKDRTGLLEHRYDSV